MYGDFECPYCAAAQPIVRRVRERLGERLHFAFRHFPLTEVHPHAQHAAEAAEAAAAQNAFWPMHDRLYAARVALEDPDLVRHAADLGLDAERLRVELEQHAHAERVAQDVSSGRAAGIQGTPTFFVNGRLHADFFDAGTLVAALEAAAS